MVLAVRRGSAGPLRQLLEAGGDPNQPDSQGSTPLKARHTAGLDSQKHDAQQRA